MRFGKENVSGNIPSTMDFNMYRTELYQQYVDDNLEAVKQSLYQGKYHIVEDTCSFTLNATCAMCNRVCETGSYIIQETNEPVCQRCGKEASLPNVAAAK